MDQHNTPNHGVPVPPYEANPSYTQQPSIQHHDSSYNTAPIQPYHAQHMPVSSPPLASEQKHEYYPEQQPQPGLPHQHQQPVQLQQMQHPSQTGYQTAIPLANLADTAAPVDCPACRMRALTRTEHHSGGTTNAWAAIICFCFCLGCIPYLISGLKDVEHKCGHCGVLLATWHRSGRTVVQPYS